MGASPSATASCSSAIDAANAAYAPDDDQRGVLRPQGDADDIGAYEYEVEVVENTPPVANAGPDQTVEQVSAEGTEVTLDGSGSSDPDGDALTYLWTWAGGTATGVNPTILFPPGTTTVTLVVNDGTEDSSHDDVNITVQDTTPPELTCPEDVTVEQETRDGTVVSLTASATDLCDADVEITSDELSVYPLGSTTVTFTATDDSGNSSTGQTVVTVVDTTPPEIELLEPDPFVLWPVNHKFVDVMIMGFAMDICDAELDIDVSVKVIDKEGGDGGPEHDPDYGEPIVQIDDDSLLTILVALRAESSGQGVGRIYEITAIVTDDSGNTAISMAQVTVPHDQGKDGKK